MARVLINLPAQAKRGEIIEIKTLIAHPMETGYRLGPNRGRDPARHHQPVSSAPITARRCSAPNCSPAIAANPFIAFFTVATESGEIVFSWTDDHGQTQTEVRQITVE